MEDTTISYTDYKTVNEHKGHTVGFNSEVILVDDLEKELIERFRSYLPYSKGLLIKYLINEDQCLLPIADITEKVHELVPSECEIVFGTEVDSKLKLNECRFNIQITGLDKI